MESLTWQAMNVCLNVRIVRNEIRCLYIDYMQE